MGKLYVFVPPPKPTRNPMHALGMLMGTVLAAFISIFIATSLSAFFFHFLSLKCPVMALTNFEKKEKSIGYPKEAA